MDLARHAPAPRGTAILPLSSTGDLSPRLRKVAIELYRLLTNGIGLAPKHMSFLLDREDRTQADIDELQHLTGNRTHFSPGRMLENSLLNPRLITEFLMNQRTHWDPHASVTEAHVSEFWDSLDNSHRYKVGYRRADDTTRWHREVHAGQVLTDTVDQISGARFEYRKTVHGLELVRLARSLGMAEVIGPLDELLKAALAS